MDGSSELLFTLPILLKLQSLLAAPTLSNQVKIALSVMLVEYLESIGKLYSIDALVGYAKEARGLSSRWIDGLEINDEAISALSGKPFPDLKDSTPIEIDMPHIIAAIRAFLAHNDPATHQELDAAIQADIGDLRQPILMLVERHGSFISPRRGLMPTLVSLKSESDDVKKPDVDKEDANSVENLKIALNAEQTQADLESAEFLQSDATAAVAPQVSQLLGDIISMGYPILK